MEGRPDVGQQRQEKSGKAQTELSHDQRFFIRAPQSHTHARETERAPDGPHRFRLNAFGMWPERKSVSFAGTPSSSSSSSFRWKVSCAYHSNVRSVALSTSEGFCLPSQGKRKVGISRRMKSSFLSFVGLSLLSLLLFIPSIMMAPVSNCGFQMVSCFSLTHSPPLSLLPPSPPPVQSLLCRVL